MSSNFYIECDKFIINNIISYLKPHEKIFINKFYYKQSYKILKSKVKLIESFYIKNKIRLFKNRVMNTSNINQLQNYFILFYPKKYRKNLFERVIKCHIYRNPKPNYISILDIYKKSVIKNNFNIYFKDFIILLDMEDFINYNTLMD